VRRAVPFCAHATASRDGRSMPPADLALPQLHGLLHRDAMASVLERSLRNGAEIDDVRVTLVDYQPGSGATVAYDVAIAGARHVAVATAGHALCPGAVRTDARRAIARALGRHSPVARPLTYDVRLGALVQWYPLDLSMPVLARPVPELLRLAVRAGIAIGFDGATTSTLVYRPGQRAVIRAGDVVLKAYAQDAAFRAGVAGMRIAGGLRLGAGPCLRGALPEWRLTIQSALDGVPVPRARAREVAPVAGAMLAVLHDADVPGLPVARSSTTLASTARAARLTAAVAPGLARRTLDLLARLEEHAPDTEELVPSHGDFNISQLLDVDGALAVLDFDEACLAPRALDVTSYAANLVSGRAGDLARADAALTSLLDGYGAPPPALHWYLAAALLRRSPSPFRLHKRRWLARTEAIVASAEAVLGR
jgi:aminoglycoside phosphotransferase